MSPPRLVRVSANSRILTFVAMLIVLAVSRAFAGLPVAESRTIASACGEFVLVLLAPEEDRDLCENPPMAATWTEEEIQEWRESKRKERQIEACYPQSGLYRNDGSKDLLWPIHDLTVCKDIYVSNDGKHLVTAVRDWDSSCSDRGHAVEFYANGRQLAFYDEHNLLVGYLPRLVLSNVFGVAWPTCVDAKFDDGAKTFEIATNWGDMFRFDISTGKLAASRLPWAFWTVLTVVFFVIAFSGWRFWRGMRRGRASG